MNKATEKTLLEHSKHRIKRIMKAFRRMYDNKEEEIAELKAELAIYKNLELKTMPNSTALIENCNQRFDIEKDCKRTYELHKQSFMSGYMNGFMAYGTIDKDNVVAEFTGEAYENDQDGKFMDNGIDEAISHSALEVGYIHTVTIRKDK